MKKFGGLTEARRCDVRVSGFGFNPDCAITLVGRTKMADGVERVVEVALVE